MKVSAESIARSSLKASVSFFNIFMDYLIWHACILFLAMCKILPWMSASVSFFILKTLAIAAGGCFVVFLSIVGFKKYAPAIWHRIRVFLKMDLEKATFADYQHAVYDSNMLIGEIA